MSLVRPPRARWRGRVVQPLESISDKQREDFLETYAVDLNEADARKKANLSVTMFRRLLDEDADFKADYDAVREMFHGHALEAIEDGEFSYAMKGNNPLSRQFILKHRMAERYGNRASIDLNIGINSLEDLRNKTDEELAELEQRVLAAARMKCLPQPS